MVLYSGNVSLTEQQHVAGWDGGTGREEKEHYNLHLECAAIN